MRFQTLGNKADFMAQHVRGRSVFALGQPVALVLDGTEDGFAVDSPSVVGNALASTFFMGAFTGVAAGSVPSQATMDSNQVVEVQVWGFCRNLLLAQNFTRAASTDAFGSLATQGTGIFLAIDTVNNAFKTCAATQGTATAFVHPVAALAQTIAGIAAPTAATLTTLSNLSNLSTQLVKAFLRAM